MTFFERIKQWLLNNKLITILVFLFTIVVSLGKFTDAIDKIENWINKKFGDSESAIEELLIRDTFIGSENYETDFGLTLDYIKGQDFVLESVVIVSFNPELLDIEDQLFIPEGGTRDHEYGEGFVRGICSELEFTFNKFDKIPIEFQIKKFSQGKTRRFHLIFPQEIYKNWLNNDYEVKSYLFLYSQGAVVWKKEITSEFDEFFWENIFMSATENIP